ncbi:MAG: M48 family metalloprotease [Actinomycetota bacterium]
MPTVSARALAALPAAVIGLLALVVFAVVIHPVVGLIVGLALAALVLWLVLGRATASALGALGAVAIEEGVEPRLESLVESVCASHGIAEPSLYTVDTPAVDAAVVGRSDDTHLVITSGLLDQLDRLEMEAVIARELSMFGSGIQAATTLASIAPWVGPLAATLRDRLLDDRRLVRADFDAVAVTRYPPALASAFEKAAAGSRVTHVARADHLWMIGSGATSVQPDVTERVDALREL